MKKISLLLLALMFTVSVGYCADADSLTVSSLAAQPTGRAVVFDEPQLIEIWYTGSSVNPQLGVSSNTSLLLYEAGAVDTTITTVGSTDTAVEVIAEINAQTGWNARLGKDAYNALTFSTVMLAANAAAVGSNTDTVVRVLADTSAAKFMTCGIQAKDSTVARIKQVEENCQGTGIHTLSVYDGDTRIWRRVYNNVTVYNAASPVTVKFADTNEGKGLGGSVNKPLVYKSEWDTSMAGDSAGTEAISIIYDQFTY
jgi:hypothetical protein